MLVVASGLVLGTGLILTLLTERTADYFAWTIKPPLTAAFLGAGYLASVGFQLVAAREREWARARVAVTATLVFTVLTTVATFLHFDRFNHDSDQALALLVTWAWIAIYVGVPPVMTFLLVRQLRVPGRDPPRSASFPPGFRLVLGLQSAVMIVLGAMLFLAPAATADVWPWQLTPLTAQTLGGWFALPGVTALVMGLDGRWTAIRITLESQLIGLALILLGTVRAWDDVDTSNAIAYVFVAGIAALFVSLLALEWSMLGRKPPAEREGFEPSDEVDPRHTISSRARSAAPAPLLERGTGYRA